ncbi:MAG: hypothetical protein RLZZ200_1919 [Pseudomonadota bacterium]|jgi:hypothetical protein
MSAFDFITIAVSLILGIGITQLLTAAIHLIRSRETFRRNGLAFAWAVTIFFSQLMFWWASYDLVHLVRTWTLGGFFLLVAGALLLFAAGAMILPSTDANSQGAGEASLHRESRHALIPLSLYGMWCIVANNVFADEPVLTWSNLGLLGMSMLPLLSLRSRGQFVQWGVVVLYAAIVLIATLGAATASY